MGICELLMRATLIVLVSMCAVVASLPAINPKAFKEETTMLQVKQNEEPVKVVDPTPIPTFSPSNTADFNTLTPSIDPTSAAPTDYKATPTPTSRPTTDPSTSDSGRMVYGTRTPVKTDPPTSLHPSAAPTTHSPLAPGETHAPAGSTDRACLCTTGEWIDLLPAAGGGSCESLLKKNQSSCEAVKSAMEGSLAAYQSMCCFMTPEQKKLLEATKAPSGVGAVIPSVLAVISISMLQLLI